MASPITFIFNLLACSDSAETTETTQKNASTDDSSQVASAAGTSTTRDTYEAVDPRIGLGATKSLR